LDENGKSVTEAGPSIPADVWQAYERLVELGFTKHLAKG
jgi:hypothetical protein